MKGIILAAGKGTRMASDLPKVLHKVCDKPMVVYPLQAAAEAGNAPDHLFLIAEILVVAMSLKAIFLKKSRVAQFF